MLRDGYSETCDLRRTDIGHPDTSRSRRFDPSGLTIALVIALNLIPTIPILWAARASRGEYFFATQVGLSLAFVGGVLVVAGWQLANYARLRRQPMATLFMGTMSAWVGAVVVLTLLNITPLCVGLDNGDGHNGVDQCLFYAGLIGAVHGAIVAGVAAGCAVLGGYLIRRVD